MWPKMTRRWPKMTSYVFARPHIFRAAAPGGSYEGSAQPPRVSRRIRRRGSRSQLGVVSHRRGSGERCGRLVARAAGLGAPAYGDWRDIYTEKWRWDRITRCSHNRANCLSACSWDVYVKDGIVWREEQAAAYDETGAAARRTSFRAAARRAPATASLMASPQRLRYPLERVGERGSGKWKRITWDDALDKVADGIIAAATEHGTETVVGDAGTELRSRPGLGRRVPLSALLGAPPARHLRRHRRHAGRA